MSYVQGSDRPSATYPARRHDGKNVQPDSDQRLPRNANFRVHEGVSQHESPDIGRDPLAERRLTFYQRLSKKEE